jgi:hypothetical protein
MNKIEKVAPIIHYTIYSYTPPPRRRLRPPFTLLPKATQLYYNRHDPGGGIFRSCAFA